MRSDAILKLFCEHHLAKIQVPDPVSVRFADYIAERAAHLTPGDLAFLLRVGGKLVGQDLEEAWARESLTEFPAMTGTLSVLPHSVLPNLPYIARHWDKMRVGEPLQTAATPRSRNSSFAIPVAAPAANDTDFDDTPEQPIERESIIDRLTVAFSTEIDSDPLDATTGEPALPLAETSLDAVRLARSEWRAAMAGLRTEIESTRQIISHSCDVLDSASRPRLRAVVEVIALKPASA